MNSISVSGQSPHELHIELRKAGVECSVRLQRTNVMMNDASTVIEIVKFTVPSIALALVAWLTKRPTRRLIITTEDKKVIHVEGSSIDEVSKLLELAERVDAIAPNEAKRKM